MGPRIPPPITLTNAGMLMAVIVGPLTIIHSLTNQTFPSLACGKSNSVSDNDHRLMTAFHKTSPIYSQENKYEAHFP